VPRGGADTKRRRSPADARSNAWSGLSKRHQRPANRAGSCLWRISGRSSDGSRMGDASDIAALSSAKSSPPSGRDADRRRGGRRRPSENPDGSWFAGPVTVPFEFNRLARSNSHRWWKLPSPRPQPRMH
jgi:hypothetical protein